MSIRILILITFVGILVCVATWGLALRVTGDRLDCRMGNETSFCALRTSSGSGLSIQWGIGQRLTLWQWGLNGDNNRRLWPRE